MNAKKGAQTRKDVQAAWDLCWCAIHRAMRDFLKDTSPNAPQGPSRKETWLYQAVYNLRYTGRWSREQVRLLKDLMLLAVSFIRPETTDDEERKAS